MGKGIIILVQVALVCVCIASLPAQVSITPGQLLAGQQTEVQSAMAARYFDKILAARARWPWVDKFEFRTETDRLMTNRQEFLFRTSFLGFSRRKFEFLRLRALAETKVADYRQDTYDQWFERCLFVVSMIKNQVETDFSVARVLYHKELDSIYRIQLAAGGDPDLRDFLKNREDWMEAEKIAAEHEIYKKIMLEKEGYETSAFLEIVDLISPETIMQIVDSLTVDEKSHPDLVEVESQIRFLEAELEAEKAKDRKILDFAQVRYTTREDLLFENRFSIGVGINIPWSGASRLRHEDIRVKQEENNFKKNNHIDELQRQLKHKKAEAHALFETYKLYIQPQRDKEWQTTRKIIQESGRLNPADIFRMKSFELDRMEKISDVFHDLLRVYIEAMYYAGKLNSGTDLFER